MTPPPPFTWAADIARLHGPFSFYAKIRFKDVRIVEFLEHINLYFYGFLF
jgi:hypothetical protein